MPVEYLEKSKYSDKPIVKNDFKKSIGSIDRITG